MGERVGLEVSNYWQYFHYVAWELLQFIDTHGTAGVMPTEADFLDVGHAALNLASAKFGYSLVAERLGLREVGMVAQTALDTLVDQCLSVDEDEDDIDEDVETPFGISLLFDRVDSDVAPPDVFGPPPAVE